MSRIDTLSLQGLDPAGPLFHYKPTPQRLDETDGEFVLVIHTAGDLIGVIRTSGDVDFYPNGGRSPQPGCEEDNMPSMYTLYLTSLLSQLDYYYYYYI